MKLSLTDTLCTRCGLCCDGSSFADVELAGPAESAGLEVMGLEIAEDDAGGVPSGIERIEYEINLASFERLRVATEPGEFAS